MPGTQPAWYMGTGVFLTLGVRKVWGIPAAPRQGQNGRMRARSLLTDSPLPAAVRARLVTPRDLLEGWANPSASSAML